MISRGIRWIINLRFWRLREICVRTYTANRDIKSFANNPTVPFGTSSSSKPYVIGIIPHFSDPLKIEELNEKQRPPLLQYLNLPSGALQCFLSTFCETAPLLLFALPNALQDTSDTEGRNSNRWSVDMQPNKKCFKSKGDNDELLPTIPNEITFGCIVPKLAWTAFHSLAPVSRGWRRAILEHRVRDTRVHHRATDTLVVHLHDHGDGAKRCERIAVYSVRDKLCYEFPPIPGHDGGIPRLCSCVSVDGRIYVLGGAVEEGGCPALVNDGARSSTQVYVLDLAGASHWKECASMERGRQNFACAVLDGKIYASGGKSSGGPVRGAEVYNPKVNAWSPIAPMTTFRYGHRVLTLGQRIFVHGGREYHPSMFSWIARGLYSLRDADSEDEFQEYATSSETYDPVKDVWTEDTSTDNEIETFFHDSGSFFVARGKFYRIDKEVICAFGDNGQLTHVRQTGLPEFAHSSIDHVAAVEFNGELLAGVRWDNRGPYTKLPRICQSEGFGTDGTNMEWKAVSTCPGVFNFMFCIEL